MIMRWIVWSGTALLWSILLLGAVYFAFDDARSAHWFGFVINGCATVVIGYCAKLLWEARP